MFLSLGVIILGIIIVASLAGGGKTVLKRHVRELEERIEELESELENKNNSENEEWTSGLDD